VGLPSSAWAGTAADSSALSNPDRRRAWRTVWDLEVFMGGANPVMGRARSIAVVHEAVHDIAVSTHPLEALTLPGMHNSHLDR